MLKKFTILVFSLFFIAFNANAGSDGELALNNNKAEAQNTKDCFEKLNRATFSFNQSLDKAIIKPIAKGYRKLPDPIQKGTRNAVNNLSNLITIPNNVLQGDMKLAFINSGRLIVNSTVGILGIFDVANQMGFPKYKKEDYGQTLGAWGVGPGCYLVLPVLGPKTARDTLASTLNFMGGDAWYNISVANDTQHVSEFDYYASRVAAGVDFRAKNYDSIENLQKNSLDFYASVKSVYLQDRQQKILNSNQVIESMDESDWEELDN